MDESASASVKDGSAALDPNNQSQVIVDKLIDVEADEPQGEDPSTPTNNPKPVISKSAFTNTALSLAPDEGTVITSEKQDLQKNPLSTINETEATHTSDSKETSTCANHNELETELTKIKAEKLGLEQTLNALRVKLQINKDELEREVQRRVELEQRFTEEAKRTTDQIEELIAKSESDDTRLNDLRKKFEQYSRETSSMIENFTTNREVLASQLLQLRQENDYLLGKYLAKSRDLQSADIDLPQNVEELQFHCLTLYEKLILSTMAKERLEETMMQSNDQSNIAHPMMGQTPATPSSQQ